MSVTTRQISRDRLPAGVRARSQNWLAMTFTGSRCALIGGEAIRTVRLRLRHATCSSLAFVTDAVHCTTVARTTTPHVTHCTHGTGLCDTTAGRRGAGTSPPSPRPDKRIPFHHIILHIPSSSSSLTSTTPCIRGSFLPHQAAVRGSPLDPLPNFSRSRTSDHIAPTPQPSLAVLTFETLAWCCAQPPTSKPPHSGYGPPCKSSRTLRCVCSMPTYRHMSTT